MNQSQDPDDFLYIMETARALPDEMGEQISPDQFGDPVLNARIPDHNFVHNISFRNREFELEDVDATMRNMYADLLSRSSSTPSIAGRGVAIQAHDDPHGLTCSICKKFGHRKEYCPKYNPNYKKTRKERSSK